MKLSPPIKAMGALVLAVGSLWAYVNPGGSFGLSQYGLTTFGRVPIPGIDFQRRHDGALRWVSKTHELDQQAITWLLAGDHPEVLIVSTGWRESVRVAPLSVPAGVRLIIEPTDKAFATFNALVRGGQKVAIHVHSTC